MHFDSVVESQWTALAATLVLTALARPAVVVMAVHRLVAAACLREISPGHQSFIRIGGGWGKSTIYVGQTYEMKMCTKKSRAK